MIVAEKPRTTLQRGFTCDACRAPIPATQAYRVTCAKCRQTYTAEATHDRRQ